MKGSAFSAEMNAANSVGYSYHRWNGSSPHTQCVSKWTSALSRHRSLSVSTRILRTCMMVTPSRLNSAGDCRTIDTRPLLAAVLRDFPLLRFFPSSKTTIRSALRIVDIRCAMMIVVLPCHQALDGVNRATIRSVRREPTWVRPKSTPAHLSATRVRWRSVGVPRRKA